MSTTSKSTYRTWAEIAALPAPQQPELIGQTYQAIAKLDEGERLGRIVELEDALYRLSDDPIRTFTRSRLRALLDLNPAVADAVAKANPQLLDKLAGPLAMKHIANIQTAGREMSQEEQARLKVLYPRVMASKAEAMRAQMSTPSTKPAATRPFWAFWKKS